MSPYMSPVSTYQVCIFPSEEQYLTFLIEIFILTYSLAWHVQSGGSEVRDIVYSDM